MLTNTPDTERSYSPEDPDNVVSFAMESNGFIWENGSWEFDYFEGGDVTRIFRVEQIVLFENLEKRQQFFPY